MKRSPIILATVLLAFSFYQCKPKEEEKAEEPVASLAFTIEEDTGFTGLPALQSFVLGETDSCWLIFGGRTNGFHGFSLPNENFPFKKANTYIYAYNKYTHTLDSMSIAYLPFDLGQQYASTNMLNRQIGDSLYISGGYGVAMNNGLDSQWVTHSIMSRVRISQMVKAVQDHDSSALNKSVVYFNNGLVRATGGELYKLPDGNFYQCVGHNFTGKYADPAAVQKYLDQIRVFSLVENGNTFTMQLPLQNILTDSLPDSITQFRRRDLVVAPFIGKGGNSYGLSLYGGVFTYAPGTPGNSGGDPFRYPVYISGGRNATFRIDSNYVQASNIYAAPNLQMYDSRNDVMYTTIFGGLGDTTGKNNASFTTLILTIMKDNQSGKTSSIYSPSGMPAYVGAEGLFIKGKGVSLYQKGNNLGIIDYQDIPSGSKQLMGYIYGGILSNSTEWDHSSNPTRASNKVYKVYLTR